MTGGVPGGRGRGRRAEVLAALAPVVTALRAQAAGEASAVRSAARSDASEALSRSEQAAGAILDGARRDGRAAGREAGAGRLAAARRQGRELVLAARRQIYDGLRASVVSGVEARLDQPDGRRLRSYLAGLVGHGVGGRAEERTTDAGAWEVRARAGPRWARLDVATVVDQTLRSFAGEIEELWR